MTLFAILLFLFFLLLKAVDVIDWSFWWVTAPLWGWFVMGICQAVETVFKESYAKVKEGNN